jgi:hypothetical protein
LLQHPFADHFRRATTALMVDRALSGRFVARGNV